jgi:hypothetical protein
LTSIRVSKPEEKKLTICLQPLYLRDIEIQDVERYGGNIKAVGRKPSGLHWKEALRKIFLPLPRSVVTGRLAPFRFYHRLPPA